MEEKKEYGEIDRDSREIIMDSGHPEWYEFAGLLIQANKDHGCDNGIQRPHTTELLETCFPDVNIPATLAYFEQMGGYCDCEVVLNVFPKEMPL